MESASDDLKLWLLLKKGDKASFTALYKRHAKRLYTYGMRMHKDHDMVSDSLQNTFIKIWTNRDRIGIANNVKYFLISSFRNNLLTLIAKKKAQYPLMKLMR